MTPLWSLKCLHSFLNWTAEELLGPYNVMRCDLGEVSAHYSMQIIKFYRPLLGDKFYCTILALRAEYDCHLHHASLHHAPFSNFWQTIPLLHDWNHLLEKEKRRPKLHLKCIFSNLNFKNFLQVIPPNPLLRGCETHPDPPRALCSLLLRPPKIQHRFSHWF